MSESTSKHGRIAFITTPRFRETSPDVIRDFVFAHLFEVCALFEVVTTGGTFTFLEKILDEDPAGSVRPIIQNSMRVSELLESDISRWKKTIRESLNPTRGGFQGMIHIAYELVEQRLDAVIHFTDWEDKSAKPDSAVLSREANVHDVPIAHDPDTASAHIRTWKRRIVSGERVFTHRDQPSPQPLNGLHANHKVLAMVAHDNMKLEICRLAVENAAHLFNNNAYDYVLATGTTGGWIRRFLEAAGRSCGEVEKIRLCNSGSKGGDIQIAYAVVQGICQKIIFLQDPTVSHPHDSDIRLFEQAILAPDVHAELATNAESAGLLIGR